MEHRTPEELVAGLPEIEGSPREAGRVDLIVARPENFERKVLDQAMLDAEAGLVGDNWQTRGSRHTPDGSAEMARQITVMNARAAALIAGPQDRWPLAGDQLYVDFDLSVDNLPPGTEVTIGGARLVVSEEPHTGCAKFTERFGVEALRFVNSPDGRRLRLRGLNARVVTPGTVRLGDSVTRAPR